MLMVVNKGNPLQRNGQILALAAHKAVIRLQIDLRRLTVTNSVSELS